MAELDGRLVQLTADIERERRLADDAVAALDRLAGEETTLQQETQATQALRESVAESVARAEAALTASEAKFDVLTGTLADLTARRHAFENAIREHGDRLDRLAEETAAVERELDELTGTQLADLAALSDGVATAQAALIEGEGAALRAEAAHSAARQALDIARAPLAEAERRAQRLETEAKTLARLFHVDTKNLWPAVIDDLTVAKGYEAALGAALGDDLEAPIDAAAPMRWAGAAVDPADPALPDGVEALADHVQAPPELARRLKQIGLVTRDDAPRLMSMLKPGQRLVSREGDLWRWDGFSVAANAPTGAARRLAGKNRLADIEAELEQARADTAAKQQAVSEAQAQAARSNEAEVAARNSWRALQHEADRARDGYVEAERQASRNAARLSALGEAVARLTASRDETGAARSEAERALAGLPPALEIETQLVSLRA